MSLSDGHKTNFDTLVRAIKNGDVALLECTDRATKEPVMVICAVNRIDEDNIEFAPFAKMFSGDPFEEVLPPALETH